MIVAPLTMFQVKYFILSVFCAEIVTGHLWLPSLPVLQSYNDHLPNGKCKTQNIQFVNELRNFSKWAVEMLDATAKYPVGVLVGNSYQLGNFDECINVGMDSISSSVHGKYCLAELFISHDKYSTEVKISKSKNQSIHHQQSAWNSIIYNGDPRFSRKDLIQWALCVPSTCSTNEIQTLLNETLKTLQANSALGGLNTNVKIKGHIRKQTCQSRVNDKYDFSVSDALFCITVTGLFLLALLSTFMDIAVIPDEKRTISQTPSRTKERNLFQSIILCFSIRRNLKCLTTDEKLSNTGFDCIHGLRLLFMILTIGGHRVMLTYSGPTMNTHLSDMIYNSPFFMFLLNGMLVIDAFFVFSGLLTSFYLSIELERKQSKFNPFMVWVYRFVRLTPVYLMVVWFHATVFDKLGWGPLWPEVVTKESERCRQNWWLNILYLNNYLHVDSMCMFQTWYLSVDTHWFILSIFLVYIIWRWPKTGGVLLAVVFILSIASPFAVIFFQKVDPFLFLYKDVVRDLPGTSEYFRNVYAASHVRGGPYMVGVLMGYILYRIRQRQLKISQFQTYLAYVSVIILCLFTQYLAYFFYDPNVKLDRWINALYGSLHRSVWGFGIAFIVFLLVHARIDWIHKALTWYPWVPLSRLTYCAYLVHTIAQFYEMGTLRSPITLSFYTGTWMFFGDLAFTYVASLVLCMLVEAPFRALEKLMFGNREIAEDKLEMQTCMSPRYSTSL